MTVRPATRTKLKEWLRRYAPAEIGGTVAALAGAWLALHVTGSLAAAAIIGTIAENTGYYGVASSREVVRYWREHRHHMRVRRLVLTAYKTMRSLLLEFGPAEALDSLLVRPGLMYSLPSVMPGPAMAGIIAAKLLADLIFYGIAIASYEYGNILAKRKAVSKTGVV